MKYYHADVFSNKKYSGNGLTIFPGAEGMDKAMMQTLTQEMRQFESIFLSRVNLTSFRAFIFTMEEELDFAGHPVIGAAALLHQLYAADKEQASWTIELNAKPVLVNTTKHKGYYSAKMNQGEAGFGRILPDEQVTEMLRCFNLLPEDRFDGLPLEMVTTGLPYLIVPVKADSLAKVKVTTADLDSRLSAIGAKFFFILDVENKQGRTWDNAGLVEDIATGSAAGPAGAYLVKYGFAPTNTEIVLRQGDFVNRPSKLMVTVTGAPGALRDVFVEGDVCMIATGELIT